MKPAKTVVWGTVGLLAMGFVLWLALHNHTPRRTMAAATAQVITNPPATPLDVSAYCVNGNGAYGPRGLQSFEHVPFQIDGMLLLWGANNARNGSVFAEELPGIAVNRKFQTLYVYHATFYGALEQTPVYNLVFRYEDGSSSTNPIIYGQDVFDFFINNGPAELGSIGPRSKLVWLGQIAYGGKAQPIRFFTTAVENPKPSLKVVTIDLYSCKTTAAACIQAMTTGPSGLMP